MLPKYKNAIDQLKSVNPNMVLSFVESNPTMDNLQDVSFLTNLFKTLHCVCFISLGIIIRFLI